MLQVAHVGDALADSAGVAPPGAAGIVVDLFAAGQLIPQLTQVRGMRAQDSRVLPASPLLSGAGRQSCAV